MIAESVVLWSLGAVACIVVHHLMAHSYEVQILELDRLITRRWFDHSDEAAVFAAEEAVEFAACRAGLMP